MALLQKAYLGATPLFREQSWYEEVSAKPVNVSSTVNVTANGSAHTKGNWQQLVASTSADASYILVDCSVAQTNANTATLLDIGTGASTSEVALIADVAIGGSARAAGQSSFSFGVPIKIPSGTRLSARIQSVVTGGKTATIIIRTFDMGDYAAAPTSVDVIGTSTAASEGTEMTGASGTYKEIIASTVRDYKAIVMVPSSSSASISSILAEFTLGIGASTSEVEIGRCVAQYESRERVGTSTLYPQIIGENVPSGTRLAVSHDIAADPENYDICLIGIP
jgi:hypothetical protein